MAYGSRSEPGLEMSGASSELVSGPWSRASSKAALLELSLVLDELVGPISGRGLSH